jgi:hypothetical protein
MTWTEKQAKAAFWKDIVIIILVALIVGGTITIATLNSNNAALEAEVEAVDK